MSSPTFKFLTKNRLDDDATWVCTSASATLAKNLYDRKRATKLISAGSNDATPEVWTVTFINDIAITIDTIILDNHNIKAGNVQYWNGSAYVDFSTPATLSANAAATNVFTFTQISTSRLRFTFNTTQTVDAQKSVGEIYVLKTIGTPETAPSAFTISYQDRAIQHETATGGSVYILFGRKASIKVTFSDATYTDVNLFESLKELGESFVFYPSGGAYAGIDRGLRLQDIFEVNFVNDFAPVLKSNVIEVRQSVAMELKEA